MAMVLNTAELPQTGPVFLEPVRIYTGVLGQVGDIILFTPTARRLKELFPNSEITFAVSAKYREAGELVAGLPYIDRLFVTELYFEKLTPLLFQPWERGWPVDLRGDDEVVEERRHHLILATRPRHRRPKWWEHAHIVEEMAHMVGVPGPLNLRTEVHIPEGTAPPAESIGKIVLHNDPCVDPRKAWPWESVRALVRRLGEGRVALIGHPGPEVEGAMDLRGQTTLAQTAAVIAGCGCYVGIESGPMAIAGSLQVPTVGLYGTAYVPAYEAVYPVNPNAIYLQAEGGLENIGVERVGKALEHALSRRRQGRDLGTIA